MPQSRSEKRKKKTRLRLMDVDVSHVSLVDRPANKTPFKFIKRDDTQKGTSPMHVHLKNMFGTPKAEVTSVIAKSEAVAKRLAALMLDSDTADITQTEGLFVVRKSGTEPGDHETLMHSGKKTGVAYTVAHMEKGLSLYDMDSVDFDEALQKNGFAPGIHIGVDALVQTIFNAAMSDDAKDAAAFKAMVSKAVDSFADYVDGLIERLPVTAFKFEKALLAINSPNRTGDGLPEGFSTDVYDAIFSDEAVSKPNAPKADAADPAPAEAPKDAAEAPAEAAAKVDGDGAPATEATADEAPKAAEAAPEPKAAEPANLVPLPADAPATPTAADMEKAVQAAMASLTKSLTGEISKIATGLNERLAQQDAAMAKLAKAMGSTIVSEPEDDGSVVQLRKGSAPQVLAGEPPLMDTAYGRRR